MFRRRLLFTLFLATLLPNLCGAAFAAKGQWQAGVAKVNISPELPIWLSGYGFRNRPANNKHDDLWAKALALQDAAGHRAVLVTIDIVGIPREISQDVCRQIEQRYKLPRSAIALCTSHTHSGPVIRGNLMAMYSLDADQSRRVKEYRKKLVEWLVQVAGEALDKLEPAQVSWGKGHADFAVNRRNNKPERKVPELRKENKLAGPVDHELPVLAVRGADGKLLAIVGGYACHATTVSTYLISADWPGAVQNELQRRHPGAVAMFVNGCGGDQNPLPRGNFTFVKTYGTEFADGVDEVLNGQMKEVAPKLKIAYEEIDLKFGKLPTREELTALTKEKPPQGRWSKYMLAEWDRDGKLPSTYPYPEEAWQLGDNLTWIFLGGEAVVDFSLRLKSELGPNTWVSSYSNDVMAYIPSLRVLREGGYEGGLAKYPYGLPAPWDASVEEDVVNLAHKLVGDVKSKTAK
jgi:neutral ceramidase